ncbi:M10 family metallopeptidase C-terminal domain-containing protein [Pseudaestuariivita atlantica]|uniref:M10 family metallopeptidase C-terminal domain-containing protein n=1 Tax=Pseudaestuariivita atlantica TaxID=1317121 RepID=UPI00067C7A3B|nr:M10 family metallopeptidase C-terminal domain-containing protein [Pseudaestuariivita atlantica]
MPDNAQITAFEHTDTPVCCCPACAAQPYDGEIDPSNPNGGNVGGTQNGLPIWSAYRTAIHIARGSSTYADDNNDPNPGIVEVTYRFQDAASAGGAQYVFEAENQVLTRDLLDEYEQVALIEFTELAGNDTSADISFRYRDGNSGGGYWNGSEVVVSRVSWEPEMDVGTYNRRLMLHEVGHGMGLSHPGPYNGSGFTYANDADHWNDSRQYSNMSYWLETETGADFGNMSTLALHDILAIQIEYGINWATRSGNDTYGFNSTAGDSYDFTSTRTTSSGGETQNLDMAFSIWDGGGIDTLDFSGSASGTELDLREGAFSSVNGQIYNVSIAYGAVIENGVGSDHADDMRGNNHDNLIEGGFGDDTIVGGDAAAPTAPTGDLFLGMSLNEAPTEFSQHMEATGITAFSGAAFTVEMMVNITRMSASLTPLISYASSGSSNSLMVELDNDGTRLVYIDGSFIDTGILTETLIDGEPHRFSMTWVQATGALEVFIDGVSAFQGTHQAGATIGSGGTLVFGQEQDSVGGGFVITETFQGTMGDIRIFDAVRSDAQIAANHDVELPNTPSTLVHHWEVQAGDTTTVTDSRGSANLTVVGGATVAEVNPGPVITQDDDTLIGGEGSDNIDGGFGDDSIEGDGGTIRDAPEVFNLVRLDKGLGDQMSSTFTLGGSGSFTIEFIVDQDDLSDVGYDLDVLGMSLYRWSDGTISLLVGNVLNGQENWHYNAFRDDYWDETAPARLSITYDHTTGMLRTYVDGTEVYSYQYQVGALIPATAGNLQFNLDDAPLGDIRIYDRALSAAEVEATALISLDTPNSVAGLVQYWTFDAAGAATQEVTGGAAMTVSGGTPEQTALWTQTLNDSLFGGIGDDTLIGGAGNDTLDGGAGTDSMVGGEGNDLFVVDSATDVVRELAGEGDDTIESGVSLDLRGGLANFEHLTLTGTGGNSGTGNTGNNVITGNDAGNLLRGAPGDDTLIGGAGLDTLVGQAGNDSLIGGDDRDILSGLGGSDTMVGGLGNDIYQVRDLTDVVVEAAGEGIDRVQSTVDYDLSVSAVNVENLTLQAMAANGTGNALGNQVYGNTVDNLLSGLAGDDTLRGRRGEDTLLGGGGNDSLFAGDDNDTLVGGDGDDTLHGNAGADTFRFTGTFGDDRLIDFDETEVGEVIELIGVAGITDFTDLITNHATQVGGNTRIDDDAGNSIILVNVTLSALQADDFAIT